jgi:hypothetical protein
MGASQLLGGSASGFRMPSRAYLRQQRLAGALRRLAIRYSVTASPATALSQERWLRDQARSGLFLERSTSCLTKSCTAFPTIRGY